MTRRHPGLVPCKVCLTEIPVSAAVTPEGADYVGYFCGPTCQAEFQRRARRDRPQPQSEPERPRR